MQHESGTALASLELLANTDGPSLLYSTENPKTQPPAPDAHRRQRKDYNDNYHEVYHHTYTNDPDNFYHDTYPPAPHHWWSVFYDGYELFFLLLVLVNAIPLVLLAAYTPKLAARLASYSCLPNGEFVLPGTASLWDKTLFFTITVLVSKDAGWDFTHAKVVDIAWDTVVGRGGQLVLAFVAYHVFHKALVQVMAERPVGFPTYAAVAFHIGTASSLWAFFRALASRSFPLTFRGRRVLAAMLVCSAYIVAIPTLFSAMTGYVAVSSPSIETPPALDTQSEQDGIEANWNCARQGNCSITPCWSAPSPAGLLAAWGTVHDQNRKNSPIQSLLMPIPMFQKDSSTVVEYYKRYKADYDVAARDTHCQSSMSAPNAAVLAGCGPLNKTSEIRDSRNAGEGMITVDAPMFNIEVWPVDEATKMPSAWLCSGLTIKTADLNSHKNVTGICTSVSSNYQWGFSYMILLIVCIMHLAVSVILYCLWLEANRCKVAASRTTAPPSSAEDDSLSNQDLVHKAAIQPSILASAIAIVGQAERHYGAEMGTWTNHKLNSKVWRGSRGIQVGTEDRS